MTRHKLGVITGLITGLFVFSGFFHTSWPDIPKTWDLKELEEAELLPADSSVKIKFVPESYYYSLPVWEIFKTYPVYERGFQPKGYIDSIRKLKPVKIYFDAEHLKTQNDWIEAGKAVFNWPVGNYFEVKGEAGFEKPDSDVVFHPQFTKQHIYPFNSLVLSRGGRVSVANLACATCHTKVTEDGVAIAGAQGTIAFDAGLRGFVTRNHITNAHFKEFNRSLFFAPWVKKESEIWMNFDVEKGFTLLEAEPAGVITRQGISLLDPVSIPSLIGIKDIKFLDKTGLMKNRGPGDIMRYAALNQGMDMLTSYNGYIPLGAKKNSVLPNEKEWAHPYGYALKRYSDVQLYALTQYLYSLQPPSNPNHFPKQNVQHGQMVFIQQGCVTCHTPPLYTNNKITPAVGYEPSASQLKNLDIFNVSVETDSVHTMQSRRGTGFYKVPSLRGLYYRQNYFHNGRLAKLEDVFDPKRLSSDYIPTGCPPLVEKRGAVKGHPFGIELSDREKTDLVEFLKTL